jgi:formiminotetrahydrofolate cyclodeaminase
LSPSAERPLADLLAALSARSPAPGGGSGAAWTGALSAALLEMAAAFADDADIVQRAEALQARLLACGERELHSYAPVLEALRLSASDPSRAERLRFALSDASDAPFEIAGTATDVAELAASVASRSKPSLAGDATAGALLAEAAVQAAARLVEINLAGAPDDPRLTSVRDLARRAAAARERVLQLG